MSSKKVRQIIRNPFKDRTPVLHFRAGQNILITLLSFAFSVSGTRLFLEITGYPQLGGGELHIAHVLWGGLLLFAAALIPIILVNEWAITLSALVSGLGVGLFIDEVGKFITSTNDYFFPSAAPIVYAFFLLTVLVSLQVRLKRPKTARSKMYEILDRFAEVLDRDLSSYEREELVQSLSEIRTSSENRDLSELASAMQNYLTTHKVTVETDRPNFLDRLRLGWMKFERKYLNRSRLRVYVIVGLFAWGIWALVSPVVFLTISRDPAHLQLFIEQLISDNLMRNASGLNWFEARIILEGGIGVCALIAGTMIWCKAERVGSWIGLISLLIALTVVNLLVFYFDQFSSIVQAAYQFAILVLLLRFRQRFLK